MPVINDIKEIESKLVELSASFILLFDKIKTEGIISQEEYDSHTLFKKEFLHKLNDRHIN